MPYSPTIDKFLATTKLGQAVIEKHGTISPTISPREHTVTAPAIKSPIVRHEIKPDSQVTKYKSTDSGGGGLTVPNIISDFIFGSPFLSTLKYSKSALDLYAGTGQDKAKAITDFLPISQFYQENIKYVADYKASQPDTQEQWTTPISPTGAELPSIDIPNIFGNVGKYILIAGGVLVGIYLLGKYIGRPKKWYLWQ